ncbi:MAG: FtsX-like permease family protein [Clostridia bacterium]|nr:FtsX-like permease family protein [Clostridia bacterium]
MKDILFLNTLRSLWRTKNRFFSILAIIALGCGFFAGVRSTCPDMKDTAKAYFDEYRLSDMHIISNVGFDSEDIDALHDVSGVSNVQPSYCVDCFAENPDGRDITIKAMSYSPDSRANLPVVIEGRLPANANECAVEINTRTPELFAVGNEIKLSQSDDESDLSDYLKGDTFTIVGIVQSPVYISFDRGNTKIGNGTLDAFCLIPDEAFSYKAYTDVYLTLSKDEDTGAFSDEYYALLDEYGDIIDAASLRLIPARADRAAADEEAELERARADYADAERGLADGRSRLENSKREFDDAKARLSDEEKRLSDGKAEYESALSEYEDAKARYDEAARTAEAELTAAEAEIARAEDEYNAGLSAYNAAYAEYEGKVREFEEAKSLPIEVPGLDEAEAALSAAKAELDEKKAALDNAASEIADANLEILRKRAELEEGRQSLINAEGELSQSRLAIEEGEAALSDARAELSAAREKISSAERDIADGEKKLSDAARDIEDGEKKLADFKSGAKWYIFDRRDYVDYEGYGTDADRVGAIAAVFPVMFIAVALLVCLTTMTRMVEEQRTQTGVLKALGFSSGRIAAQYVIYAASASVAGGFLGLAAGFRIFPAVIMNAYGILYNIPGALTPFKWGLGLSCIGVALLCTVLSALFACGGELNKRPAALLRPKPPKSGKRVFLEHTPLWKHMSFTKKVTARNIFRYKGRVIMTVVGIAGCSALMLTGFMLRYSITAIVDKQFDEVFIQSASMLIDDGATDGERLEIEDALAASPYIDESLFVMEKSTTASAGDERRDTYVFVPSDESSFGRFVNLHGRVTREEYDLSRGAVITEKLSRLLGVGTGDTITVGEQDDAREFTIAGVCENYAYNYVFISHEDYERVCGRDTVYNAVLINMPDVSKSDELSRDMLALDGVLGLSYNYETRDHFKSIMDSLNYIVYVIIFSAGLLAFVVLYNLTNINVNERIREIATIKVLGFTDRETAQYIYRENMVSTFIGVALGLVGGIFLGRFVVTTAEVEIVMFAPDIAPSCFVWAAALTILFALLVNFALYFRLKRISMAGSLSAME